MTMQTLIVFDCDGTLVDSQHLIVESMRLAFQGAGLPSPDRLAVLKTVGLSLPEAVAILAPLQSQPARDAISFSYRDWSYTLRQQSHLNEPMFSGAAPLLFGLASRPDLVLGIATGKSRRGVTRFLEQNGLSGLFSTVQTADDAPSKPHPAMLLKAMAETGASPEKTVMIGDTSYDIIMATRARVAAIGVSWGYQSELELRQSGAKAIVGTFSALGQALAALFPHAGHYEAVA